MITYEGGTDLLAITGSVFPRALPWGILSAIICIIVGVDAVRPSFEGFFDHPYAHQVFSIAVGFILVFRANLSYQRFWEGRTQVAMMSSKWEDAALQCACFERVSKIGKCVETRPEFIRSQLHLFSLLHTLCIMTLRGDEALEHIVDSTKQNVPSAPLGNVQDGQLEVLGGLTEPEREILLTMDKDTRAFKVMTWMIGDITVRHKEGGLEVPPPVLARLLQSCHDGMQAYMQAVKIAETPFPFPYAQMVGVMLIIFVLTAPIVVSIYVTNVYFAVVLALFSSIGSVALNEVAKELEGPFGYDANDLPLSTLNMQFNKRIKTLGTEADTLHQSGSQILLIDEATRSKAHPNSTHAPSRPISSPVVTARGSSPTTSPRQEQQEQQQQLDSLVSQATIKGAHALAQDRYHVSPTNVANNRGQGPIPGWNSGNGSGPIVQRDHQSTYRGQPSPVMSLLPDNVAVQRQQQSIRSGDLVSADIGPWSCFQQNQVLANHGRHGLHGEFHRPELLG